MGKEICIPSINSQKRQLAALMPHKVERRAAKITRDKERPYIMREIPKHQENTAILNISVLSNTSPKYMERNPEELKEKQTKPRLPGRQILSKTQSCHPTWWNTHPFHTAMGIYEDRPQHKSQHV